jgi:DNA mismatch repair protein MSH6
MAQWWEFKSRNMDTVLFFKVGKFYELFHMDADIGMSQIDLIYMKGSKGHSGFPEISYGKYSSLLVAKGYRVARVEQTETPDQLAKRNQAKGGKKEKVVSRECCSVMSKGTRTYCHLDDLSLLDENINGQSSSLLMCIKEIISSNVDENNYTIETPEYGICCIDTVIGTVTLAQFQDDSQRSRLRTMISRYIPSEVLLEANQNHPMTVGTVRLISPKAIFEILRGGEMPDSETSKKQIKNCKYFQTNFIDNSISIDSFDSYPPVLKAVMEVDDSSTCLVLSALGGAIWQLKRSLIDYEVISMGKFYGYAPPDAVDNSEDANQSTEIFRTLTSINDDNNELKINQDNSNQEMTQSTRLGSHSNLCNNDSSSINTNDPSSMTLDAVALSNLEVLVNNFDHTERGSLWAFINRCKTPFGKRLLRDWLCHPLFKPQDINRRGDAIEELLTTYSGEADTIRNILKNTPDLERLLTRVHSNGLKNKVFLS